VVKIDKSLITADDEQPRLLFTNVVRTLRELKLATVAEGVETAEQLMAARRAGVTLLQGHLIGEAVDMDELLRRVGSDGTALAVCRCRRVAADVPARESLRVVGATGLEPAVSCSQSRRASHYATPRATTRNPRGTRA
jgi:EAL domain-containing protein